MIKLTFFGFGPQTPRRHELLAYSAYSMPITVNSKVLEIVDSYYDQI
jgi:hypothetical protein